MIKNVYWKTILLTIFVWALFWEIEETSSGKKSSFMNRWPYYEMSFAKNIEVLPYILTDEQVIYMLSKPDEDIQQPTENDLYLKDVNVVFRVRHHGGGLPWGKLLWRMGDHGLWHKYAIAEIPGPTEPKKYCDYIIPVGVLVKIRGALPFNTIQVKWNELYVSHQ